MTSLHVQELRGHYVRRLPTPEEISFRSPIVLTERDMQVLVAVHQHGFLTTDLVQLHPRLRIQLRPYVDNISL